ESEPLTALNRHTWSSVMMPRMLSGHLQGRYLAMISKLVQPKCALEIGTYTGYSAICMAEGLAPGGMLHTIDINEELEELINSYIEKAGNTGKIRFHLGNALEIVNQIDEQLDLVFTDADKEN